MFFNIYPDTNSWGKIFLSRNFQLDSSIYKMKSINIKAGNSQSTAHIETSLETKENVLIISQDIIENLSIPTDIPYQLYFKEGTIYIGPIIGLLLAKKNKLLTKKLFNKFNKYALKYSDHKGLLYIFSADSIDFNKNTIQGFYFDPSIPKGNIPWKKGNFPFPSAIYRRVPLSKSIQNALINITDGKMFNSHYFDKWDFNCIASSHKDIGKYIPFTKNLSSIDDIEDALSQFDSVYIKPISGSMGHGIKIVSKDEDGYFFQARYDEKSIKFSSKQEASGYVKGLISKRKYIVQQSINSLKFQDRHTHIRVIMQKDESLEWKCTGIIAYMGKAGGICTIYPSGWYGLTFEKYLKKFIQNDPEKIVKKKQEVIDACIKTCNMLDSNEGNFGDLGIDVIIDENLRIWILEVNKTQNQRTPLSINNIKMFNDLKTNPIRYAIGLSGFKVNKS
jgi:hypothetical protein